MKKGLKIIWALLVLSYATSCATEADKFAIQEAAVGVVSETFTVSEQQLIYVEGDSYTVNHYYIVINGDTVEYSGYTYPEKETLLKGDSVWVYQDWQGRFFLSAGSDAESAIDSYMKPRMFSFGLLVSILLIILFFGLSLVLTVKLIVKELPGVISISGVDEMVFIIIKTAILGGVVCGLGLLLDFLLTLMGTKSFIMLP